MANYVQTSIENRPAFGVAGMSGDGWGGKEIDHKIAIDSLVPGRACALEAGQSLDGYVKAFESGDDVYGIVMIEPASESSAVLPAHFAVPVARKGRVWVDFLDPENAEVGGTVNVLADGQFASTGGAAFTNAKISKVDPLYGLVEIDVLL